MNEPISSTMATPSGTNKPLMTSMQETVKDGELDPEALKKLQQQKLEQTIVGWARNEYRKCKEALEPFKRQWYLNLSYYKGDQYVEWIDGRIVKVPLPKNKARLTINRIRPVIRTELSRLTSQDPTAEVIPASTDSEDILAAEASNGVFEATKSKKKLQSIIEEAAFWTTICGTGFIKTAWDKSCEEENPDGTVNYGDHQYTAVTPFHLLVPELLVQDIEDQPYVMNVFTKPIEWVRQRYGEIIPEDKKPSVVSTNEIIEPQYLNTKGNTRTKQEPDSCLILEVWVKPKVLAFLPKGGMITIVDDIIVQAHMEGLPYKHGEYPFAKIVDVPTGSFYGTSVIEDLIPLQNEFNRNRSQQVEARNMAIRGGFFYTEGSLNPNKVTNAPGQLIGIKPGAQTPVPIPPPQLPSNMGQEIDLLKVDFEDISGQHQVSKGNTPAGVTAGTAIQFLAEQDNSFMATTYSSLEQAVEKVARHTIQLFIQYVDTARAIKIVGRDNTFAVKYLKGVDIKSGTDIKIESGSSLPVSKAARIAMFTDWITRGIIPPQDGLKLMRMPSMKSYWDVVDVDEIQAQRENLRMRELPIDQLTATREQLEQEKQQVVGASGFENPEANPILSQEAQIYDEPVIPVNDFDNHDVHIEIHTRFMKGQEYESMPEIIQEEFKKHVQAHKDAKAQTSLQQIIQQGMEQEGDPNMEAMLQGGGGGEEESGELGDNQFSGMEEPPVDDMQMEQ